MGDEYYDIESILAENQKVQCTFKVNVPDMGHLAGGEDRDVSFCNSKHASYTEGLCRSRLKARFKYPCGWPTFSFTRMRVGMLASDG